MGNIFLEKSCKKCGGETITRPFSAKFKQSKYIETKLQTILHIKLLEKQK